MPALDLYSITVGSGERMRIEAAGNLLRVRTATGDLEVLTSTGCRIQGGAGISIRVPEGDEWVYVDILDLSGASNTVTILIGDGVGVWDDSQAIVGEIDCVTATERVDTITDPADITLDTSGGTSQRTKLHTGDPSAVWVDVENDPDNLTDIRVGSVSVDATHGWVLRPGDAKRYGGRADLYAWNVGDLAAQTVRTQVGGV